MIYLPVINCRADSTTNPLLFTHTKTRPMDARTDAEKKGSERSENQCVIARRERSKGWGLTRARSRAMGFIRRSPSVIRRSPSVIRRSSLVIRRSSSVIRRSSLVIRQPSRPVLASTANASFEPSVGSSDASSATLPYVRPVRVRLKRSTSYKTDRFK